MKNILPILVALTLLQSNTSWAEIVMRINIANPDAIVFSAVPNANSSVDFNDRSTFSGITLLNILAEDPGLNSQASLSPNLAASGVDAAYYSLVVESEILSGGSALSLNIWSEVDDNEIQDFQSGVQAFSGQAIAAEDFGDFFVLKGAGATGDIVSGYIEGSISNAIGQWEIVDIEAAEGRILLEEPVNGEVHGGIGNLRGFAVFQEEVEKVEVYIDGEYAFDAPYGGDRADVETVFPEIPLSRSSGFSLAYGYSNLIPGEHTILVRAIGAEGLLGEDSSTFTVQAFNDAFIAANEIVDGTAADIAMQDDEIVIRSIRVADSFYNLVLKWRTAEQGFEIIEIVEILSEL